MRSLAAPIIIAPEADTWPGRGTRDLDALALQVAVTDQGGEQHGDGHRDLDEDVEAVEGDGPGDGHLGAVGGDLVPLEQGGHQGGHRHGRGHQRAGAHAEDFRNSEDTTIRASAPPIMISMGRMLR